MLERAQQWIGRTALAVAKRFTLQDLDKWMEIGFLGTQTAAGIRVSPRSALKQADIRAAIANISTDIARMPLPLQRRDEEGRREQLRSHRVWDLLNGRPNPEMTAYELRRQQWGQFFTHGNIATEIDRDGMGRPLELWPLDWPNLMIDGRIAKGTRRRFTYVDPQNGRARQMRREDLFLFSDFNLEGDIGESRLSAGAESIGLALAIERYAAKFFANNGRPGLVLKGGRFKDDAEEKEAMEKWNKQFSGGGQHGVGYLTRGLEIAESFPTQNNEAQMVEARTKQKEQNLMLLRFPPHLAQDLSRGTFSNIARQGVEYVVYTLLSHMIGFEQAIQAQLLDPAEQAAGLYVKHNVKSLLRGDPETQANFYRLMVGWRLMTVNEVRDLEDLDPSEGGNVFLQPGNMIAVGQDGKPVEGFDAAEQAQTSSPDDERQAVRDLIRRELEEMMGVPSA